MGSGKHSTSWKDKRNSFDNNDYSNNFTSIEEKKEERYQELNDSDRMKKIDQLYDNNINFSEANFFDEEEKEFSYKPLIIIGIIIVLIITGILVYKFVINKPVEETELPVEEPNKMSETIEGYKVLGKIKISDLNIEQYILDSTESKALDNGVGKIENGGSINNYGNFCIAGHNQEEVFENLENLEVDDKIILVDKDMEETTYKVTKITEVEPDNLECLLQDENKIELTLITCKNGATTRLIVKAEEENSLLNNETINDTEDTNTINTEVEEDI